jgi:hypothetical protein
VRFTLFYHWQCCSGNFTPYRARPIQLGWIWIIAILNLSKCWKAKFYVILYFKKVLPSFSGISYPKCRTARDLLTLNRRYMNQFAQFLHKRQNSKFMCCTGGDKNVFFSSDEGHPHSAMQNQTAPIADTVL